VTMTNNQLNGSVDYNRRRGYSRSDIEFIQELVGATPDGAWGPETVLRTAEWQAAHKLDHDGRVGPSTYALMRAGAEIRDTPKSGEENNLAGSVSVGCGLAAYDQSFPGHKPEEAMQVAYDMALKMGAREVRFWSSEWLIQNIGHKGNLYSGPWLEGITVPPDVVIGAWIDDPIKAVTSKAFVERLQAMHISVASLMINRANTTPSKVPWDLRWTRKELETVGKLYDDAGIEIVCTAWPQPNQAQIDAMCNDMTWILEATHSTAFEVDTESNWHRRFLRDFGTMQEAGKVLGHEMRIVAGDCRRLEQTTYTYHAENSSEAVLAPYMDRLLPQAYSVRHRDHVVVEWDDVLGPGQHQRLAMNRARQAA